MRWGHPDSLTPEERVEQAQERMKQAVDDELERKRLAKAEAEREDKRQEH